MSDEPKQKWVLEPHLCSDCGGRILRCVEGNGMTPGGNAIRRCADCGKSGTQHGADAICWCGVTQRGNSERAYRCLPFSVLETEPWLEEGFRACGCDPKRGEVGIMLTADLRRLSEQKTPKESGAEAAIRLVQPLREWLVRVKKLSGRDRTDALDALDVKLSTLEFGITYLKESPR